MIQHHPGPHDNSPLLGAIIGAISGIYKSVVATTAMITFDGLMETAVYAIIGSALGAVVSFYVNHLLSKWKKSKKR
ncbi:MAG TPA: hypothetical protein VL728_19535 [Cyclobacteriaceae bacterium]|jgi:hypothetical protein|nr:hypothetical protein [Cyclobacteriaceae bacterium]